MKKLLALLLTIVMVLGLVACGGNNGGSSNNGGGSASNGGGSGSTGGSSNTGDGETVVAKLAVVGPLTGEYKSEFGDESVAATQMAIDEWNEKGVTVDGKKVVFEMVTFDDAGKAEEGAALAQQIVADKDIIAVPSAHYQSAVCLVACPTYQQGGLLALATGASHPDYVKIGDYVVRNNCTDMDDSQTTVQLAYRKGYRKIAIAAPETDYGVSSSDMVIEWIEDMQEAGADIEFVGREYYPETTDDYASVLSNLNALNPDCVISFGAYSQACPFCVQKQRTGATWAVVSPSNCFDENLIKVGGDAVEGMAITTLFDPGTEDPAGKAFVTKLRDEYGIMANHIGALAYDSANYICYLVQQTGSLDRETLKNAAHEIEMPGVTGTIVFGDDNECGKILTVVEVKDGAFVSSDTQLTKWDDFLAEL